MKKYYANVMLIVAILIFICISPAAIAQNKKERKKTENYLFNVKLRNKSVFEKVNFKLHMNAVIVPITINGKLYNFLFDTGAITILSDSLLKHVDITKFEYSIPASDAAGIEQNMEVYYLDDVNLGAIRFDKVGCLVANLDDFEKHMCIRVDGILGTNILRLLNWEIDFLNQDITVSNKPFSTADYEIKIPFEESFSRSPQIKMRMGGYYFFATLDMGNNDLIQIPDSLFFLSKKSQYLQYAKGEGKNRLTLFNDDTPTIQYVSEIDTLYIGNNLIINEVVDITPSPSILIGNTFLAKHGKIVINWKNKVLFLGNPTGKGVSDRYKTMGFSPLLLEDKLIVSFIWENTTLYKTGVRVGDQITSINGISTEKVNASEWCEIQERIKDINDMHLELRKPTGEKITVHAEEMTYKALLDNQTNRE